MAGVDFRLPEGAKISNHLFDVMDVDDRTQDLVVVELPNGYFIDVGWYPEHDPDGRFLVRVFYQYWDDQRLDMPIEVKDFNELVRIVEQLAERYSRNQFRTSTASVQRQTELLRV